MGLALSERGLVMRGDNLCQCRSSAIRCISSHNTFASLDKRFFLKTIAISSIEMPRGQAFLEILDICCKKNKKNQFVSCFVVVMNKDDNGVMSSGPGPGCDNYTTDSQLTSKPNIQDWSKSPYCSCFKENVQNSKMYICLVNVALFALRNTFDLFAKQASQVSINFQRKFVIFWINCNCNQLISVDACGGEVILYSGATIKTPGETCNKYPDN